MVKFDFYYDGKISRAFGVFQNAPAKIGSTIPNTKKIVIPGRNGTLTEWDGTYQNIRILVPCFFLSSDLMKEIREANLWLVGSQNYKKLTFSHDEEHFYLARAVVGISQNVAKGILNPCTLEFDAMPQRYLVSGSREAEFTDAIYNPTREDALPIIKIEGNGSFDLTVGENTAKFTGVTGSIELDTETGNAVMNGSPANSNVKFDKDLILKPGRNAVTVTGGAKVKMIPRWWEI